MILLFQAVIFDCFSESSSFSRKQKRASIQLVPLKNCQFNELSLIKINNVTQYKYSLNLTFKFKHDIQFLNITDDKNYYIHYFTKTNCVYDVILKLRNNKSLLIFPNSCNFIQPDIYLQNDAELIKYEIAGQVDNQVFAFSNQEIKESDSNIQIIIKLHGIEYHAFVRSVNHLRMKNNLRMSIGPGIKIFDGKTLLTDYKLQAISIRGFKQELQYSNDMLGRKFQLFLQKNIITEIKVFQDNFVGYIDLIERRDFLVQFKRVHGCIIFDIDGDSFYLALNGQLIYSTVPKFCQVDEFDGILVQKGDQVLEFYPDETNHQQIRIKSWFSYLLLILLCASIIISLVWYKLNPETEDFEQDDDIVLY